jgi:voltage-gated potassium channel
MSERKQPANTTAGEAVGLRQRIDELYGGRGEISRRFRYGLLAFDLTTVAYFMVSTFMAPAPWMRVIDLLIAIPLILDLLARFLIADKRVRLLVQPSTWVDTAVIASLLSSVLVENLRELRASYPWFRQHEEMLLSALNLVVFVFVVSSVVYILQGRGNTEIFTFLDALYFTVATLTTTGFGDITLQGNTGRLLSVLIMVVGVGLFLRLLQTIFRPPKINHECPDCGLQRHDPDAVHCKHCGNLLHIETEGE